MEEGLVMFVLPEEYSSAASHGEWRLWQGWLSRGDFKLPSLLAGDGEELLFVGECQKALSAREH